MGNKVTALTVEINLSNKHLTEIPIKPLKDFLQLRAVNLSYNQIASIPEVIAKDIPETPKFCDNLQVLELQHKYETVYILRFSSKKRNISFFLFLLFFRICYG
jgi:hypothetical protein